MITQATYQLNDDIGVTLYVRLDDVNMVVGNFDNSNATFTLRQAPIGDLNNDGSVGSVDVETWSKLSSEDHWTKMTNPVSSIDDHEMGKFTFAATPSTDYSYTIKYKWFPRPYDDNIISKACTELASYLCFLKVNLKDVSSSRIGKVSVSYTDRHPGLVSFYDRYKETLGRIRGRTILRQVNWEMVNKMAKEMEETVF